MTIQKIDVGYHGDVRPFEFNKLVLDKNGSFTLIVDFTQNVSNLDMAYNIAFVLNPSDYNDNIKIQEDKLSSAQSSMLDDNGVITDKINAIHDDYREEALKFPTFEFKAAVLKFEKKSKSRQVKFAIDTDTAMLFSEHFDSISKAALVLDTYSE